MHCLTHSNIAMQRHELAVRQVLERGQRAKAALRAQEDLALACSWMLEDQADELNARAGLIEMS